MKKTCSQIFKILILLCFISVNAQTINYDPAGFYVVGQPVSTLAPNQSGVAIEGGTYRDVSLFAGTGNSGGTNTSSSITSAFQNPRGIVKDHFGNYYVSEVQGKRIRKISPSGVVTTVVQFTDYEPRDIVINSDNGELYVVVQSHRIIRIANSNFFYPNQEPTYVTYTTDAAVPVFFGSSTPGYTDDGSTSARFNSPWGLAIAPDNSYLLVADFGNNRIRKCDLSNSNFNVSTFVPSATFSGPTDVHIVNNDLIYVAEFNGNRIQKISGGSSVSLFVSGTFGGGNFDGTGATGFIDQPHSLTADGMGNVYVVERMNHKVRKITPQGKVTTLAGTLWNTDNSGNQIGTGYNTRFRFPTGIFYDIEGGFLLIADTDNHQLKKVQLSGFEVLPPLPTGLSLNTSTGVISGTPTVVSLQNVYQNNFNTSQLQFLAGETVTLADNAAVIGDYLQLTPRQNNSKGGITIEPFESNGFGALKVSFDLITTKTSADNTSADGFSYSFAPDASATATAPTAEIGTGTKLTVSFATFGSNRGIRIFYNPASNQSLGTTLNSVLLAYTNNTSWMGKSVKVVLDVTDMGDLTLTIEGETIFTVTLPANFSNSDKSTWKHVFKARTGLSNDLHAIDNLSIQLRNGPTRHTVVGRDYNNEVESTFLINSSVLPTVSTQSVTSIQYTQATVNYQILGPGSSSLSNSGFVWSTTPSPTIFDNAVIHPSPAVIGNQSLSFDDLLSGTTYYVRAVVTNEWGVYAYGQELSFTTLAFTAPTVSTNGTTAVTQTTAVSGGNVTNDGGNTLVERGICWSTNPNPTIANTKIVDDTVAVGVFTSTISELNAGTVYYIRAYATNSLGTTYGNEQSFMTIPSLPTITYPNRISLGQNIATITSPTVTGGTVVEGFGGITVPVHPFPNSSSRQFALSHDTNFFYYASNNAVYKINREANETTVLAGGSTGTGDGMGAAAQFQFGPGLGGIAVNKTTGHIYVLSGADQTTARIRQITPDGVVTTLANLADGDLGIPTSYLSVDGLGNIFYVNQVAIGKIPCITNSATPVFGTPIPNWAGSAMAQGNLDGIGSAARFRQINGKIAIDAANNLYVTDLKLIRKITPEAVVSTIAGNTDGIAVAVEGIGTSALFSGFSSFSYNHLDNALYGTDFGSNSWIRKINLSTMEVSNLYITTGAGAGWNMEILDGHLYGIRVDETIGKTSIYGYSITPNLPVGLSLSAAGQIIGTPTELSALRTYFVQSVNPYHVVRFSPNLEVTVITAIPTVTTLAINSITQTSAIGSGNVTGLGGAGSVEKGICWSTSSNPTTADNIIVDDAISVGEFSSSISGLTAGTVYYVRAYATNSLGIAYGNEVSFSTLAPPPTISYSSPISLGQNSSVSISPTITGGTLTAGVAGVATTIHQFPAFNPPFEFVLSHDTNYFYYAYAPHQAIYKITRSTGALTVLAGNNGVGSNDGVGTVAQFNFAPSPGIAVNKSTGNIYVIDQDGDGSFRCRQITPAGVVTTVANNLLVLIGNPYCLTVDELGSIYYVHLGREIAKIPCINNSSSPIFGSPILSWVGNQNVGTADGTGTNAQFRQINSIAVDSSHNLYVYDRARIRKITTDAVVTTLAGNVSNMTAIDGIGTNASFTENASFVYNQGDHALYGNDGGNIRKVDLVTLAVTTLYPLTPTGSYDKTRAMLNGAIYGISFSSSSLRKTPIYGYSISPNLPAGLFLSATGQITGTPTALSPLTTYTIQSVNPYHVVTTTTQIEVVFIEATEDNNLTVVASGGQSPSISNGVLRIDGDQSINLSVITDYLSANTSLSIEATGNISFDTALTATGDVTIIADADGNALGDITFNQDITAAALTLRGKNTVVAAGKHLNVSGNLVNDTDLTLDSRSNAFSSLKVGGAVSGTGDLTYSRYVNATPSNDLIAAPFAGMSFSDMINNSNPNTLLSGSIGGQPGFYLFGPHNEQSNSYEMYNSTTNANTPLTIGKGYRVGSTDGGNLNFAVPSAGYTTLSNTITVGISHTGEGWNLVGNPYPTYLALSQVYDNNENNLYGDAYTAIYTYNGNATNPWTIYNGSNGTDVKIAPGQAFFVRAAEGGSNFSFTPSMQSSTGGDDFITGRSATANEVYHAGIALNSSIGSYTTEVYFHPNGSTGLDVGYDAANWQNSIPDFGIYSHLVEQNQGLALAIQTLNTTALAERSVLIPLGVESEPGLDLEISLLEDLNLPLGAALYLEDRELGVFTNLSSSVYSINSQEGFSGTGRFYLQLGSDASLSNTKEAYAGLQVYAPSGSEALVVAGITESGMELTLYDMLGRTLLQHKLSNESLQPIAVGHLSAGPVVVLLRGSHGSRSLKVIINH